MADTQRQRGSVAEHSTTVITDKTAYCTTVMLQN